MRLGNNRGDVAVRARLFDGLQPAVIVVESIRPSEDFSGGIGIDVLASVDPAPPFGGAVFHDSAVWLRAAAAELAIVAE